MGLGLLEIMKVKPGSSYGLAMFLGVAWASNLGSVLTPGGTPTNLIAIGLMGEMEPMGYQIGYAQWFWGNLPFTLLQAVAMFLVLRLFLRREDLAYEVPQETILEELRRMGPFSRGEKFATGALFTALFLWVLPELSSLILGRAHPISALIYARLNWGLVGVVVAVSLFLLPIDWKASEICRDLVGGSERC